jgi:TetR/AcrR family transcriptional regulator
MKTPTTRRRKKTPKPQPRAEITRASILKAALREFAHLGLAGARVDVIARRAGVNKQVLYYHFGNKEDLFRATLASVYDHPFPGELIAGQEHRPSSVEEMRELISGLFKHFRNIEEGTSLIGHENRYHGKHLTPALRRNIRASVFPIIDRIRAVLHRGQKEGAFNSALSVDHLYLTLVAMSMFYFTHAYTLSAILDKDLLDEDAIKDWQRTVETVALAVIKSAHTSSSGYRGD